MSDIIQTIESLSLAVQRVTPQFILDMVLGGNKATARNYQRCYVGFAKYVSAPNPIAALTGLIQLSRGDANAAVTGWRVDMAARECSPSDINLHLSAVRTYVKECKRCGLICWELDVQNVRSKGYRDTAGPGHDNYKAMLAVAVEGISEAKTPKSLRDTALLRLLYDVGLRRSEVAGLDLCDVDPEREWGDSRGGLAIIQKRDTEKTWVGVPAPVMAALSAWIAARGNEPGPLFLNLDPGAKDRRDRRLSDTSIYRTVVAYANKAGIQRTVSPHRLRHGGATRAARLTGNAMAVKAFLRHGSLDVAQRYVDNDANLGARTAELVAKE